LPVASDELRAKCFDFSAFIRHSLLATDNFSLFNIKNQTAHTGVAHSDRIVEKLLRSPTCARLWLRPRYWQ
jgi:hypothetical protein